MCAVLSGFLPVLLIVFSGKVLLKKGLYEEKSFLHSLAQKIFVSLSSCNVPSY